MHQSLYLLALLGSLHAAAGVELEHAGMPHTTSQHTRFVVVAC